MALIQCPECGKKFSNLATECPNCGFPIDEKNHMIAIVSNKWESYYTGMVKANLNGKIIFYMTIAAPELGLFTPKTKLEEQCVSTYLNGFFDGLNTSRYDTPENMIKMFLFIDKDIKKTFNQFPQCPNCGSYDVKKISGVNRVISFELWGGASSKIGKSYGCNSCGYKW